MPNKYDKTLKYNHGEKSLKAPFAIYFTNKVLLPKSSSSKIILKNLTQTNKESAYLQVSRGL